MVLLPLLPDVEVVVTAAALVGLVPVDDGSRDVISFVGDFAGPLPVSFPPPPFVNLPFSPVVPSS